MIRSKDRSGYIGASDTKYVVGKWNTKTFKNWWLEKLGLYKNNFSNKYTMAGTNYEHKIIDALNIPLIEKDKQIIIGRLRVNLDANTKEKIHEIKTYYYKKGFDISKHKDYINQVQVQMYASDIHSAEIDAYGLLEEDYKNYFNDIDKERLSIYEVEYNEDWIKTEYLPKLKYLEFCLDKGKFPNIDEFEKENKMKITTKNVKELWELYEDYKKEYKRHCISFKELSEIYSFEEFVDNEVTVCSQCEEYILTDNIGTSEIAQQDNICLNCMEEKYGR